jgi:hypothetical protein
VKYFDIKSEVFSTARAKHFGSKHEVFSTARTKHFGSKHEVFSTARAKSRTAAFLRNRSGAAAKRRKNKAHGVSRGEA